MSEFIVEIDDNLPPSSEDLQCTLCSESLVNEQEFYKHTTEVPILVFSLNQKTFKNSILHFRPILKRLVTHGTCALNANFTYLACQPSDLITPSCICKWTYQQWELCVPSAMKPLTKPMISIGTSTKTTWITSSQSGQCVTCVISFCLNMTH